MDINKIKLAVTFFSDYKMIRTKLFSLLFLSVLMMLLPTLVQADMVFDFQMKLAKKENVEAQFKVGEMYETGFGVEKDLAEAEEWITKAARRGHETASFKLLYWDLEKNGLSNANKINLGALKAKAKNKKPQALYYLGKMYARGVGVKKSTKNAVNFLNKAAFSGVAEAESELAMVREYQQKQIAIRRRVEEKNRAELKARQEREKLAQLEQRRKIKAQKIAEKRAAEKSFAEELSRQNVAAEKAKKELALAKDNAANEKARLLKLQQDKQLQAKIAAKREALMAKKREEAAARQKASFESDPCSGKSARFLSTCR